MGLVVVAVSVFVGRFALAGEAINYADPPQGVFIDEWMSVEMMGVRAGYAHNEVSRTGDEINTSMLMAIVLKRAGSEVKINMRQSTRETLKGQPLAFTNLMDMSNQILEKSGVIENGKVKITSKQFGLSQVEEHDYPAGAFMSWGMLLEQHRKGYEAGTKYQVRMYEPSISTGDPVEVDVEIVGPEQIEIDGAKVDAIKATQSMMGIVTESWMDKAGSFLRTRVNMMGMPMVMTKETKESALAEFAAPEFFAPTTIHVARAIDRHKANRIEYKLSLKNDSVKMPDMPNTAMQSVLARDDSEVRLAVERLDHKALQKITGFDKEKAAEEYLTPNAIINCEDPAVIEMAKRAKGDAKTPYEIADRLRVFVTDEIREKNLDVGFATASEVCRDKVGDCSEHAVLLAALGRVCGLPSRVVIGLVYVPVFGGQDDIFGFHMWTQFLIGDKWVDFDAAQRESDCNPTHIAFGVTSLKDSGLGQIAFTLASVIGNLDIDVESVQMGNAE